MRSIHQSPQSVTGAVFRKSYDVSFVHYLHVMAQPALTYSRMACVSSNHLVSEDQQRLWHVYAERMCLTKVKDQVVLG